VKAITAGKDKSDRIDARMIADLLRCNLLPACYAFGPFSVSRFPLRTSPVSLASQAPSFGPIF
jgi:hypothetical protein